MNCEQIYYQTYHHPPESIEFCPYRISPLGAYIDHQFGKINGLAINRGIHIAYSTKQNGVVELQSMNFPKRAQFHINSIPEEKVGDWADHCRGAAKMLAEKYPLRYGLSAVIEGTVPQVVRICSITAQPRVLLPDRLFASSISEICAGTSPISMIS